MKTNTVSAMSIHNTLRTPALAGMVVSSRKGLGSVSLAQQYQKHPCIFSNLFSTNPRHSPILATAKKTKSNPAACLAVVLRDEFLEFYPDQVVILSLLRGPAFVAHGRDRPDSLHPTFNQKREGWNQTQLSTKEGTGTGCECPWGFWLYFPFSFKGKMIQLCLFFFSYLWCLFKKVSCFRVNVLTSGGKWQGMGWGKDWAAVLSLQSTVLVVGHYWLQERLLWEAAHHVQQSQYQMAPGWTRLSQSQMAVAPLW